MGAVSGAVIDAGGDVTGITPMAMVAAGGEVDQRNGSRGAHVKLQETGREKVRPPRSRGMFVARRLREGCGTGRICEWTARAGGQRLTRGRQIVVNSMHERKAEMAKQSCAFVALPGGFGTFEEVLEVVCWTQIGLHSKRASLLPPPCARSRSTAVLVLNVRGFYNPLRELVRSAIRDGFILERNEGLLRFVDGPEDLEEHASFDWGKAALETLDAWQSVQVTHYYNWKVRKEGEEGDELDNA